MSRTTTSRRLTGLAAPALAGALLVGCGPTATPDPQASASSAAPTIVLSEVTAATSGAGTARVQVRSETSAGKPGSGASLNSTTTVEGVLDFASGNGQLVTELPTGGRIEQRTVDGVQYTRLPEGVGGDADKPWLKLDLPEGAGLGLGQFSSPAEGLTLLREAAGPLTEVGREQVRGAETVRYRTELDLAKIPVPTPSPGAPGEQPDPRALLERLLGDAPLPVEVWVDDAQRIRRLTLVLPLANLTGGAEKPATPDGPAPSPSSGAADAGGTATTTTEYFDFGVAVDVQAPPADEVRAAPKGLKGLPSAGGGSSRPVPSPTS